MNINDEMYESDLDEQSAFYDSNEYADYENDRWEDFVTVEENA